MQFYSMTKIGNLQTLFKDQPLLLEHFCDEQNLDRMKKILIRYSVEEALRRVSQNAEEAVESAKHGQWSGEEWWEHALYVLNQVVPGGLLVVPVTVAAGQLWAELSVSRELLAATTQERALHVLLQHDTCRHAGLWMRAVWDDAVRILCTVAG